MALFSRHELKKIACFEIFKEFMADITKTASEKLMEESSRFSTDKTYDIFMSHSYTDAEEIYGVKIEIENMGFSIYIDWIEDERLDRSRVSRETAERLKERMNNSRCLFYVASEASPHSTWMPWELGYFDGLKSRVAILPIVEQPRNDDYYRGQEYLGIYPYVSVNTDEQIQKRTLFIKEREDKYVSLRQWLEGKEPSIKGSYESLRCGRK